jgi:predicted transposase YdaD
MRAEELIALQRPALLPLVGQTRIDNPAVIIPEVVSTLKTVSNAALRGHLFSGLLALVNDEEITKMIDRLVEKEELLTNTPFLRRIREEARTEALIEGRVEGRVEGRAEGRAEGLIEGIQISRRQDILDLLVWRFDPPASLYQQIEKVLATITDVTILQMLHKTAAQAPDLAEFQSTLAELATQP